MGRLDKERQLKLEPKRVDSCKKALEELGYCVDIIGQNQLNFIHNGHTVQFFPYSGWHTGKSIKDGRGFFKLKRQLENNEQKNRLG
jgi:hypothetical protein